MADAASPTAASFWAEDRFGGDADAVYSTLVAAHDGLSEPESAALNARLVLLLSHAVGDPARIAEAARLARSSVRPNEDGR